MRRLLPTARSFLSHSSHVVALAALGVMAMAMAPSSDVDAPEPGSTFAAPPITAVAAPAGPVTRLITFENPVKGRAVNSVFGLRKLGGQAARSHEGVDIAAPRGTGVFATAEGVVLRTGYDANGYGSFVEVRHPNGMTSLYGHLSRVDVHSGMALAAGQRLGLVGSTGRSTGPHLHFEVRRAGRPINPERVIDRSFEVVVSTV